MRSAPHWHGDNRVPTDLRRLITVATPNPLVIAWRWRYEIALVAGLSASLAAAIISFGALPTIVAVTVITLTILCWPTARQFAVDRAWCIITTHRVRVGCAEGLIYSSRGKIPIILWTSHQASANESCCGAARAPALTTSSRLRAVLTAACWAQDVNIFFDTHNTHLVTLDVIRRPLGKLISDVESRRSPEPPDGPPDWPGDQDI